MKRPIASLSTRRAPKVGIVALQQTTGLVIHAAADGIALGASSVTTHNDLSFIIFFAIMVHKAPAAFGLTSILLKQGISKRTARAHLLLFSFAAPDRRNLNMDLGESYWRLQRKNGGKGPLSGLGCYYYFREGRSCMWLCMQCRRHRIHIKSHE